MPSFCKFWRAAVWHGPLVLEAKPRTPDAIIEMLGPLSGLDINQNDIEVIYSRHEA